MRRYWTCQKCGTRNERTWVKCRGEVSAVIGSMGTEACTARRPKPKVPRHAEVLRDNSYQHFRDVNELIHGQGDNCGVCGTPPKDNRNLQREHDHVTGQARGLACWRCNRLMPKQFGLTEARAIVAYLERVEAHYAKEEQGDGA
jgi:recombination endonuclease VII